MKRVAILMILLLGLTAITALPAFADGPFFYGSLDSSLPFMSEWVNYDCSTSTPGTYYYTTATFYVPDVPDFFVGYYDFFNSLDVAIILYPQGGFDPAAPANNCIAWFDDYEYAVELAPGTYTVVITSYDGATGSYEFALGYPGVGDGAFFDAEPLPNGRPNDDANSCVNVRDEDPDFVYVGQDFTPAVSGEYTYYDLFSEEDTIDIWFSIYQGTFDPENPLTNCLANWDDEGTIYLQAGVTYFLMVSTLEPDVSCNCEGTSVFNLVSMIQAYGGDFSFLFMTSPLSPGGSANTCTFPLPAGAVVRSIPNGAPAYWAPNLNSYTNFDIPAGMTWYVYGESGEFSHVWIACQANPVWVLTSTIAP